MKQKLRIGIFGFGRTGKIVVGEFLQASDIEVQWVIKQTPLVETQYLHEHFTTSNKKALLLSLSDLNDDFFETILLILLLIFLAKREFIIMLKRLNKDAALSLLFLNIALKNCNSLKNMLSKQPFYIRLILH